MFDVFLTAEGWISLATLTSLEIVLGLDNIVFISILTAKLPAEEQPRARQLGLGFALLTRLGLLFTLSWFMGLTEPVFEVFGHGFSWRHIILLVGGIFLIGKSTLEIYEKLEVPEEETKPTAGANKLSVLLIQIALLDIVFSIDSVITAVGMVDSLTVMVVAMVVAMIIMVVFANPVGDFVNAHPSMKVLALAFLLLVGVLLVAEGLGQHVNKGTIYFAMFFSLMVELVNMRMRKAQKATQA